ncbi:hypothetical protein A3F62_03405 [Candidatus Woesebacteria bacterium RIFCSPHIGHO2_12_FULL_44_11]|uniref:Nucleotidyltransferase n=1 Tax=Candidatus Woesebacteria bacterium RIFCSPLOWO2_01_FULL_44_14 TaxID=1802525 RepID=A0A1F8BXB4_9BACT|nr:MAG: hypothetical protein A3F62_03405 [Candidatus Woesebacteria bacterium RIFCSPHIGHO2_12_FULL_44_11]OGM68707.1 MAG: hypothetical protein A2975_05385 [Candidatus Woesebacteria bacterium RIFCSPLOWO2_01_FULL_44_14]
MDNFLDGLKILNINSINHYIVGLFAVRYYLEGHLPDEMPEGEDIDIVIAQQDSSRILDLFSGREFEKVTTEKGEIITKFYPESLGKLVEFTLFNDFRVNEIKIDFGLRPEILKLTKKIKITSLTTKIASLDLLIAQKLVMFRGEGVYNPCDKRDLYLLIKNKKCQKDIGETLNKVLPVVIERNNKTKQTELKSLLTQRYHLIKSQVV